MNNLERLRSENPLVICYTNDVVKNFTANGLLSLGASPAMSEAPEEAEDFTRMASALLINIGTLTRENEEDIIKIGKIAREEAFTIWGLFSTYCVKIKYYAGLLISGETNKRKDEVLACMYYKTMINIMQWENFFKKKRKRKYKEVPMRV